MLWWSKLIVDKPLIGNSKQGEISPREPGRESSPGASPALVSLLNGPWRFYPKSKGMVGVDGTFTVNQKRVYERPLRTRISGLL